MMRQFLISRMIIRLNHYPRQKDFQFGILSASFLMIIM